MSRGAAGRTRLRIALLPLVLATALGAAVACTGVEARTAPRRHVVEIRGLEFVPASLTVAEGDTVVWVNHDIVPHTATATNGGWDSGSIAAGGTWSRTFRKAEAGAYLCTFHPGMTGRLTIR